MHYPSLKIGFTLIAAALLLLPRLGAQITTSAAPVESSAPARPPASALVTARNPLGDLPTEAAATLSAAIRAAMSDPAVQAAQEKFKTQMNLGVAKIRDFIDQNPATKAFMADHPALGAYLATRAVQTLAATSGVTGQPAAAAQNSSDALLAGLPPETVATLQALVKSVQADATLQTEMQKGLSLGLAFNAVLRDAVSKDPASKALVDKYPAAFDYLSTTFGVLPPSALPAPPARPPSPILHPPANGSVTPTAAPAAPGA